MQSSGSRFHFANLFSVMELRSYVRRGGECVTVGAAGDRYENIFRTLNLFGEIRRKGPL